MKRFFLAFIKKLIGVRPSKCFRETIEHDVFERWEKGANNGRIKV